MSNIIPDGYELLAGRSKENAQKALDKASEGGFDKSLVRTVSEGYLVPVQPEKTETPDASWKVDDIDAWAAEHDIEVSGKKDEKIVQINEALAAKEGE